MSTPNSTADSTGTAHGGPLDSPAARRGFLLVVLAGITWGTAGFSGSLIASRTDLGPLDIAWYRMAIGGRRAVRRVPGVAASPSRRASRTGPRRRRPAGRGRRGTGRLPTRLLRRGRASGREHLDARRSGPGPVAGRRRRDGARPRTSGRRDDRSPRGGADRTGPARRHLGRGGHRTSLLLGALFAIGLGPGLRVGDAGRGWRAARHSGDPDRLRLWRRVADAGRPRRRRCTAPPTRSPWHCCSTWGWCRARWPTRCSSPGCAACRDRWSRS